MEIGTMKSAIMSVYPGSRAWQERVIRMPDRQVIAIYNDFMKRGRFEKNNKNSSSYHQMTIFEYMTENK